MRFIKIPRLAIAALSGLGGMSLAWLAAAAPPPGTAAPADFSRCAGCHSTQAGQNKIGPSLADVFGRTSELGRKGAELSGEQPAAQTRTKILRR